MVTVQRPARPRGGGGRPRAVDTTVAAQGLERLASTNDYNERGGRPTARVIRGISIVAGTPTPVAHGCGTASIGWVVSDVQSLLGTQVWRSGDITDKYLTLSASANCTVAIEVWAK